MPDTEEIFTVKEYCEHLGWLKADLQRQAGITWPVASKAYDGQSVSSGIKQKIAAAISDSLGRKVLVGDIQWQEE